MTVHYYCKHNAQAAKLVTFWLIFKWTSHCAVIKEEQVCRDMLNECESSPREGINRRGIVVYSEQSKYISPGLPAAVNRGVVIVLVSWVSPVDRM